MKSAFNFIKLVLPGLLVAFALAIATDFLSRSFRSPQVFFDPLFFGLLLGFFARRIIGNRFVFWPGFGFAQDVFVPLGILLYAAEVRWNVFSWGTIHQFLIPIVLAFLVYYLFLVIPAARNNLRKPAAILVWGSLALLGPISVVLLAPALQTTDEETSLSLILAAFCTSVMIILFPLLSHVFSLNIFNMGTLSMLTLPLLSPINPATSGIPEAVQSATFLFALKVAILGPVALALVLTHQGSKTELRGLPLVTIAGFILIGLCFTFLPLDKLAEGIYPASEFALTLAMVSVGLSTNLRDFVLEKNRTLRNYLILGAAASLTAFLLEAVALKFLF